MASIHKDPRGKSPFWYCAFYGADGRRMFRSTKETDRRKAFKICLAWEGAAAKARRKELTAAQARKVIAEMVAISSGETMSFQTVRRIWDLVLRHPLHPYRPQKSLLSETSCARKDARWPPVMRLGVC